MTAPMTSPRAAVAAATIRDHLQCLPRFGRPGANVRSFGGGGQPLPPRGRSAQKGTDEECAARAGGGSRARTRRNRVAGAGRVGGVAPDGAEGRMTGPVLIGTSWLGRSAGCLQHLPDGGRRGHYGAGRHIRSSTESWSIASRHTQNV